MIAKELISPKSIVVVGGTDNIHSPGGKVLKNLIDGNFAGPLYIVNPKKDEIQGLKVYATVEDLPQVDLAIMAIAAKFVPDAVKTLTKQKGTRGFIVLSAGFSEESHQGAVLEHEIVEQINSVNGSLIGPNCIGLLNTNYNGVFTTPIPSLDPFGVDFISGSGATAVFIMESGVPKGLKFNSVYSVGNSAQLGVEEILEHLDTTFDPRTSSKVKLLYIENVNKPDKLYRHAASLIQKGCRIAAIKSGGSEAGSRAASSHTGALASPDKAVDALFKKAGIVRCHSREELTTVASVFMHPPLTGKRIAVITHAGGPAVMLTDALSNGGLEVPHIEGEKAKVLLEKLFPGSSVANPIDFLATGTAAQLGDIIDAVNNDFDHIDAMVVVFGSPGLFPVFDVYDLLDQKMKASKKPIYPVLPSIVNVADEIKHFIAKGRINFPDEVLLGQALAKVYHTDAPTAKAEQAHLVDTQAIRAIIDKADNGYLSPEKLVELLDAAGISRAGEAVVNSASDAVTQAVKLGFPVVMKVVGPVHKSDVGGVVLNVKTAEKVREEFDRMIQIKDTTAILIQPMLSGTELFVGAKREDKFGHMVLFGLGGIFIEVLGDVQTTLIPVSKSEALDRLSQLNSYGIIKGVRGQAGVNQEQFAEIVERVSALVSVAPEIFEMDLNPLLGSPDRVVAVDARIRIER